MPAVPVSVLDFKLGLRMLRRYPGITAIGTIALAVAIALGMLYFEALNKVLHPVLPIAGGEAYFTSFRIAGPSPEPRQIKPCKA